MQAISFRLQHQPLADTVMRMLKASANAPQGVEANRRWPVRAAKGSHVRRNEMKRQGSAMLLLSIEHAHNHACRMIL
jgi:hypothetical protein